MVKGTFIDTLLYEPSYGWKDKNDELVVPTKKQLFAEAFSRINIFKTKKNWISFVSFLMLVGMLPFFYLFLVKYFSWYLMIAVVVYAMVIMGTHGTIWLHRYCTHKSYGFSNPIWRIITQNLVIKTVPEEIYVVSHHVHHCKSDEPGDPYNPQAGLWYCMLAEYNHQRVSPDLSEEAYQKAARFMKHTGVKINSYKQYQKWGSIASPAYTVATWVLNWSIWYLILFLIGGPALACAIFSAAMLWFALIRAFNYTGHGGGKENTATASTLIDPTFLSISPDPDCSQGNGIITTTCFPEAPGPVFFPVNWIWPGSIFTRYENSDSLPGTRIQSRNS